MFGKCFALEGLECSGKTTLFNQLKKRYAKTNTIFFPEVAEKFFNKYNTNINGNIEVEIGFMTYNSIIIEKTNNLIIEGYNVIMDRSWLCQLVYSQARAQVNRKYIFDPKYIEIQEEIFNFLYHNIFNNMVVVFIDLPIESILKRRDESNHRHPNQQLFDKKWLENVLKLYQARLSKAQTNGMIVEKINSDVSIEKIVIKFHNIFQKYATITHL